MRSSTGDRMKPARLIEQCSGSEVTMWLVFQQRRPVEFWRVCIAPEERGEKRQAGWECLGT
jgi:hypothetical protein